MTKLTTLWMAIFTLSLNLLHAQYQVATYETTLADPARNNRSIPINVYYPSDTGGSFAACAAGGFPYVIIAHGFSMQPTNYVYLSEHLATHGYIVICLGTETGFLPSHENYGLDIAFLANHFIDVETTAGTTLEGHVLAKCAAIGHSMGGGATFLAASQPDVALNCVIGMAPAETTPSAITASSLVTIPVMVLSGTADAVTAAETNHIPMYEAAMSACKIIQHIQDGSHCGFADDGNLCFLGEPFFAGLDYAAQRAISMDMVLAWLNVHLKDDAPSWSFITQYDNTQTNTTTEISCTVSVEESLNIVDWKIYPNPAHEILSLERGIFKDDFQYTIVGLDGRKHVSGRMNTGETKKQIPVDGLCGGVYMLHVTSDRFHQTTRFLIAR
ncbi:MAG: serine aminopeptidase domain-containing protein [Flavobacteriales bacterium]